MARLRLTLTAGHSMDDIDVLLGALAQCDDGVACDGAHGNE